MTVRPRPIVDTDPLGAVRDELLAAARRRTAARRRRRQVAATVAAALGLLAVAGGALAVTNTTTGVAAIDRMLETRSRPLTHVGGPPPEERDGDSLPPGVEPPPMPDLQPSAGGESSAPVEVELADGTRLVAVGYVNRDHDLCTAIADPGAPTMPESGAVGCIGPGQVERVLAAAPARIISLGGLGPRTILLQGIAAENVRSVTVDDGGTRVEAALSEAWVPIGAGSEPVRVFVVTTRGSTDLSAYRLEVQLDDGQRVRVAP